jgi:hypothetical protein
MWQMTMITALALGLFALAVVIGLGGAVAVLRVVALLVVALCAAYAFQLRRLIVQVEPGLVRVRSWRAWREYRRNEAVAIPAEMKMTFGNAESIVLRRNGQRLGGCRLALDDFPREDRARLEEAIMSALQSRYED